MRSYAAVSLLVVLMSCRLVGSWSPVGARVVGSIRLCTYDGHNKPAAQQESVERV